MRRSLLPLGLLLTLAACSTTAVDVAYQPGGAGSAAATAGQQQRPVVAVSAFADQRGEDPNWLGSIRGGYGNPLKTLTTPQPVAEVVRKAFADGLASRGLLADAGARYTLNGTVQQFDASQYARREATAKVLLTLKDASTGRTLLAEPFEHTVVAGSILTLRTGVFASVDDLRDVAAQALNGAVDKALDSPAFRQAVR
jgi:uncharacterized lipoprotein YajG